MTLLDADPSFSCAVKPLPPRDQLLRNPESSNSLPLRNPRKVPWDLLLPKTLLEITPTKRRASTGRVISMRSISRRSATNRSETSVYRGFFSITFAANTSVFIGLTATHQANTVAYAFISSLFVSILMRQEYAIKTLFSIFTAWPRSTLSPSGEFLLCLVDSLRHYGHSRIHPWLVFAYPTRAKSSTNPSSGLTGSPDGPVWFRSVPKLFSSFPTAASQARPSPTPASTTLPPGSSAHGLSHRPPPAQPPQGQRPRCYIFQACYRLYFNYSMSLLTFTQPPRH